ncbi:MAG: chemotaxis protein CheA, partial [Acidimicrobiales bacterium]|nr:chemotaxis protein CheA [Acidimicrobiales bacterium]
MDEIVADFLSESREALDAIDDDLLALERGAADASAIERVFRSVHTVKGTCGFFGFGQLEQLSHAGENLLTAARDGQHELGADSIDVLLKLIDRVRSAFVIIEQTESDDTLAIDDLTDAIHQVLTRPRIGDVLVEAGAADRTDVEIAATEQQLGDQRPIGQILSDQGKADIEQVESAAATQVRSGGGATLRVDVALLDQLMNLVGELVLVRNQILANDDAGEGAQSDGAAQRLNLITSELQEGVMKTRMQPISAVWRKLPRIVRDLSKQLGKQVKVEMIGEGTELDKTIIEALSDPMVHVIRNTVDHGIEAPETRLAAGKSAEGVLTMRAWHEGGQVNIEVSDDGGGVNLDRVRAVATERGLVDAERAAMLSDNEVANLIFLPGFSTAKTVSNVSGRGVGMDVVKTSIEKIGGSVEVRTRTGQGTAFRFKIPLTLAIVPALAIGCAGNCFVIPQLSLIELVRLDGSSRSGRIESVHGSPVYRLRDRLLPIVHLREQLGLPPLAEQGVTNIVVLQADEHEFGLVVDEISETQEIVVKPLGRLLQDIPHYSGATILGDGSIAMIIDVMGLAQA